MTTAIDFSVLETVDFNDDGFMVDANDWTPAIGKAIAAALELELTDRHWEVINFSRAEFVQNGDAPALLEVSKGSGVSTRELYQLFPGGPAKVAAQIAGLPKPTGCI